MAIFNGTTGTDMLFGELGNDTLNGLGGIDYLYQFIPLLLS